MSAPYTGNSQDPNIAGVAGVNSTSGAGVWGESSPGRGVVGVSAHGTGIWGHTEAGRAVVGANNQEGTGVWGETKTGRGVVGVVQDGDGAGVWGECNDGRGVVGVSEAQNGTGVWGETTKGRAVVGVTNQDGAGVWGETKGAGRAVVGVARAPNSFAGYFDGNVQINGDLALGQASIHTWLNRIAQLERELAAVKSRLPAPGGGTGPTAGQAVIDAELKLVPGSSADELRVYGRGFAPNEEIEIYLTQRSESGGRSTTATATADPSGNLNQTIAVFCQPGQTTEIYARGVSSGRLSNLRGVSC